MKSVKYINSKNQEVNFFGKEIKVSDGSFHNRKWNITDDEINKNSINYTLTLTLRGTLTERKKKLNELHDIFEIDLINKTPGRLFFGDYYIYCYISSAKTEVNKTLNSWTDNVLEIHCPCQSWINEKHFSFFKYDNTTLIDEKDKCYPYTFPYKYGNNPGSSSLLSDNLSDSNFVIIVYGPVSNPSIMIGSHLYNVNVDVGVGEYLRIDSISREIFINDVNGNITNVFEKRNKENYIFNKISPGLNNVDWSGGFGFDVILFDERSEPKWI